MNPLLRFGIFLLLLSAWLSGCGAQTASEARAIPPSPTPPPISLRSASAPTAADSSPSPTSMQRLFTYADNDQTITLRVGERFDLMLGPSAGSSWLIRVTDPDILQPPIHELGPNGSAIVLEPVRSGETTISANSHVLCQHPGPCPEVFLFFTLKVKVLAD